MNELPIRITRLAGPLPPEPVISADVVRRYFDAASIVEQAHAKAAAIVRAADEALREAEDEARRIRARAHEEGLADADETLAARRRALIDETVQWCVEEAALEEAIAARVERRLRELVCDALGAFLYQQDSADLLMRQIRAQLPRWLAHGKLTIRVAPDVREAVARACADTNVEVAADASLDAAHAVLDTPFVSVSFDIDADLRSVLGRLVQPTGEEDPP
ncbi:hypothetical protein WKR88_27145 [Trinickia caryophylli]|uniref:Flagellar biosynthesis/type III secretory pathway protein FliH n=1 Tax=Trinickia caryophylli TaxID=28094 RepID=A0A1X7EWI5_TRICW|nr:hypothetical protein [Trinickia caryophylli]PMS09688.1 hypothetical protein C0Z17_23715 [Trinickia caryophylli]TRX18459.1 hypothetical protein FNF07_09675 [Trinickia caryophylli]WQE10756.1 hypothetical protein U0034_13255 [Trinickia caryophylli]SMF41545.1 Flagellar biosynthesis/type III secretory pathway protein FliH [Trinickia caryophylli]GLU33131.1 hypothetical protein Busp01_29730 [Trinickia caryophylli]